MPELPEVETLKRELSQTIVNREIKKVEILWPKLVTPLSVAEFQKRLRGRKITAVERRAKILIFELAGGEKLLIHLKLTGQLVFLPQSSISKSAKVKPLIIGGHPEDPAKYRRGSLHFADGSQLVFNDLRKFGWWRLAGPDDLEKILPRQGVEPLTKNFNRQNFPPSSNAIRDGRLNNY